MPAARPRLLVVAGPNGAGKTTITERGLAHEWFHDCEYVNPDLIAQDELGDWNDADTVLRAAQLATEIAAEVDRFYVYDNSVDDRDAQLVLRASTGHIARQYGEPPAWSEPIITRLVRGTDEP